MITKYDEHFVQDMAAIFSESAHSEMAKEVAKFRV